MDYLDPDKKRKHTQRLFIGYALMAILIALGTTILVLLAHGYTFDRKSRTVIQNGLLFVDTSPVNANVYINDELSGTGRQRQVLPAGDYTIRIEANGYHSWQKSFTLAGGSVERFAYPLLFPEQISSSTYRSFQQAPQLVTTSPDRSTMLIQEATQTDAFVVYDLTEQVNLPTFFSLPVGVMSQNEGGGELELVEWSNNNQHVVLKHTYDGGQEFLLLNTEAPARSQNLTTRFSDLHFTNLSLVDRQFDEYHLFNRDTGELVFAELETNETELVREDILTYRSHGPDTILFVQNVAEETGDEGNDSDELRHAVYLLHDEKTHRLTDVPSGDSSNYLLDIARFSGSWYAVVGNNIDNRVSIYEDPVITLRSDSVSSLLPKYVLRTNGVSERVSFSNNARNILLQAGNEFAVYDLERERAYQYTFGEEDTSRAYWMDGHRLLATWDNTLHVIDFDGENKQTLTSCRPNYQPAFDRNYEYLYCVAPSNEEGVFGSLQRSSLLVEES